MPERQASLVRVFTASQIVPGGHQEQQVVIHPIIDLPPNCFCSLHAENQQEEKHVLCSILMLGYGSQERPAGRQGHSAAWDLADSLIVFGGLSDAAVFSDVHVLSLSTGFWSAARTSGQPPSPRYGHSATMIAANLMLVFGGCNAQARPATCACCQCQSELLCWHIPAGHLPPFVLELKKELHCRAPAALF